MTSNWNEYLLEDITEIIFSGGTPLTKNNEYWNGEFPWLSSGETRYDFISSTEKTITEEGIINSSTKLAKKNDIVIASAGQGNTRGQVAFCKINTYINQSVIAVRTNEKYLDPLYFFYNLKNRYRELRQISDGHSIRGSLTTKLLKKLKINVPAIEEQKRISSLLYSLDQKIETNNQINENLEEIAQALFKYWFVDFEFPNENGEPYNSSGDEMVESELGMIPKGWEVNKLNDYCEIQKGLSYKGKHLSDSGIPMINLGNIYPGGGFRRDKMKYYDGDYKHRHKVKQGDLIIANTDMTQDRLILGSPIIVPNLNSEEMIFTHHLFALRNIKMPKSFLYYYLKSDKFRERAESFATGTTVLALPKNAVVDIDIILPDRRILNKFETIVGNILLKKELNNNEVANLEKIRDTLLPKLMSGEIRVPLDYEALEVKS